MLLLLLLVAVLGASVSTSILDLTPGKAKGFSYNTTDGVETEVFLNIPFAKPPIGKLRFEKPESPLPWTGVRDGSEFGPRCLPFKKIALTGNSSEDCLQLNIIRPKKQAPPAGFPAVVWVHGGGFVVGSAVDFGYAGFANIYASKDIVVVTVQYRLGAYGFLALPELGINGNLALWDLTQALKFINENAKNIGIDKSRITIFGHSAGSAAVQQLTISPKSRDLFSASIEMAGSGLSFWSLGAKVPKHANTFVEGLGCHTNVKNCLNSKSTEDIYDVVTKMSPASNGLDLFKFTPRFDGDFFPAHPKELIKSSPKKPTIVGLGSQEAAIFTILGVFGQVLHTLQVSKAEYATYDKAVLTRRIKELLVTDFYKEKTDAAVAAMTKYYALEGKDVKKGFYLNKMSQFFSDILFNVPVTKAIIAKTHLGWPVYAYSLDHYNPAIFDKEVPELARGSPHLNEYPYTFEVPILGQFPFNEQDNTVKQIMTESFTSFIKTSNPTNHHSQWPLFGSKLEYLSISGHPRVRNGFHNESVSFFNDLQNKYGFDILTFERS